jgi:hypothetical protein
VRRVLRDLAKGVRNPESLPTAQLRNLAAVHHGPMAALFSLAPADEALLERLLGEPEEEHAVNPFEVDKGSSPAPDGDLLGEEQGYSHGADAARLRQIEAQLRVYEMEHQWTEGGELADFNFRSLSAASAAGEQAGPQGSSQSMAVASGDHGAVSSSCCTVVNNRTREQAEYFAAVKLVMGAAGGGGVDGDAHLVAAREARAAAEAAEAVDRRLRALQTSALPVRLSAAAMAALVSECKAQQEASRPPASAPDVEPEEQTAGAADAASGGGDAGAAARAEAREARAGKAAAAEATRERKASGRAERKPERTVVVEGRERVEGGKLQESMSEKKAEDRGVGPSAKAKARAAERSAAAAGGGKAVRSERLSSSSDSGRSRELRPTSTHTSATSTTLRAERENRPVAASTANLPRPDLGLSGTRCACGLTDVAFVRRQHRNDSASQRSAGSAG